MPPEKYERRCDFRDGEFVITYLKSLGNKDIVGTSFTWEARNDDGYKDLASWVNAEWNDSFMYYSDKARIMLKLLS